MSQATVKKPLMPQCPILDTLVRPIEVHGSATINGQAGYTPHRIAA